MTHLTDNPAKEGHAAPEGGGDGTCPSNRWDVGGALKKKADPKRASPMRYRLLSKIGGALCAIASLAALTLPIESSLSGCAPSYLLNTRSGKSLMMFELTPREVVSNSLVDNLTALFQMVFVGVAFGHVTVLLHKEYLLICIIVSTL